MVDVLVIGGGLAGWRAAEAAAKAGASVALVANGAGNSPDIHALNVPVGPGDSVDIFLSDTLRSGRGACDPALAETLCREAVALADEFPWDRKLDGSLDMLQPVGCSVPRCVTIGHHIGAWALAKIKRDLAGKVEVFHDRATALERHSSHFSLHSSLVAKTTVLATGGWCGKYAFSDNPPELRGDGIALAQSLGAAVRDMDAVQYEPTVALAPDAVRGIPVITTMLHEGATFRNRDGAEFLPDKYANKDELSRVILAEIAAGRGVECPARSTPPGGSAATPLSEGGLSPAHSVVLETAPLREGGAPAGGGGSTPCGAQQTGGGGSTPCVARQTGVWFDATGVPADVLRTRYADTVRRYAAAGVDVTCEPMLVAPAPHTSLGGVVIDARCRVLRPDGTPIPGLFAAGEVTGGVHGLNRIGGSAGTEVLVFGRIAGTEAARFVRCAQD